MIRVLALPRSRLRRIASPIVLALIIAIVSCRQNPPTRVDLSVARTATRSAEASGEALRYAVPIVVEGLAADGDFVKVMAPIDLTGLIESLGESGDAGPVDERSLRLYRVHDDGSTREVRFQFEPAPQPRMQPRRFLPRTTAGVSYIGEVAAGSGSPERLRVAGELHWLARPQGVERATYRLEFAVPQSGSLVQVPYGAHNLRSFDDSGKARRPRWFSRVRFRPLWPYDGTLEVLVDGKAWTTYHVGPLDGVASDHLRRSFLYPVRGPGGHPVTEVGKPHDPTGSHAHHRSLWIAHASVAGQNFWSQRGGRVVHEKFDEIEDGAVFARLAHRTRWVPSGDAAVQENAGDAVLLERRRLEFFAPPDEVRWIDFELEYRPAQGESVTLGKTTFGFLAVRVAASMTVFDGAGEILNARDQRNEQQAHLQRAEWIDLSGPVAPGVVSGVAILDHPDNPRHPTAWHCRNDGWAGAALCKDEPLVITAVEPLRLRYRVILHEGDARQADVARRYREFIAAPRVEIGEARRNP